jgi:hypothetical protein
MVKAVKVCRQADLQPSRFDGNTAVHKKSSLNLCYCMMDEFMVRGSKGPMQWMLDLWTYDLKMLTIEPAVVRRLVQWR